MRSRRWHLCLANIVWAVGERVHARLADAGLPSMGVFSVQTPSKHHPARRTDSRECEARPGQRTVTELHLFYNRHTSGAGYVPVSQRLLPLDETWRRKLADLPWPTKNLPEVMGVGSNNLASTHPRISFVSLFRACAESLASENASRLAAMQRADKNINDLLDDLMEHSIVCARVASTRNCSMLYPASKR